MYTKNVIKKQKIQLKINFLNILMMILNKIRKIEKKKEDKKEKIKGEIKNDLLNENKQQSLDWMKKIEQLILKVF